jgi:hypothetical protein
VTLAVPTLAQEVDGPTGSGPSATVPGSGDDGTITPDDRAVPRVDGEATEERSPWSPFPIIGYSPETSGLFGAGTVYTFETGDPDPDAMLRRSSLTVVGWATLKRQYAVGIAPSVYLDGETWQLESQIGAALWPNTFYPIGDDAREEEGESYSERVFAARLTVTREVFGRVRAGARIAGVHATTVDSKEGGLIGSGRVPGGAGGVVVGVGPVLVRDSRDNNFETRRGGFYQLLVGWYDSATGSEFEYVDAEVDMRRFVPLWAGHTLAFQLYSRHTWGNPPFQLQAPLGGKYNLRGYFEGRFRDRHSATATAEYRLPVWWRVGAVGFAGVGQVAPALDKFDWASPKVAGGIGLRFSLNPADRINLRVDGATNAEGDLALYVHLGEAF